MTLVIFLAISFFFVPKVDAQLGIGSSCAIGNDAGVCRLFKDCPKARNDLKQGISPTRCPAPGFSVIVCCPLANVALSLEAKCPPLPRDEVRIRKDGRKARDKCIDYYELLHPCLDNPYVRNEKIRRNYCGHTSAALVIGGVEAKASEFPHMASLGFDVDEYTVVWDCGGTLISDEWVLSAAHCAWKPEAGDVSKVRLGETDVSSPPNPENLYTVSGIITHPNYTGRWVYNDIMLVKLDRKVQFTEFIIPACLHFGNAVDDNKILATGWGFTKANDIRSKSNTLMKVVLEKFEFGECDSKVSRSTVNPDGVRDATQMCYGSHDEEKDTCQGDSGSPIQIYNVDVECMYTIVGLTSFGRSCAIKGQPGVYTRLLPFVPWIESIVWD